MDISVIIPVYHSARTIARCIQSVLDQSFMNTEIIVVDDCGVDSSMEIALEYAKVDDRVRIVRHPQNRGTMKARETGYLAATGDYLFFLDADDYLPPYALFRLYDKAVSTQADIVAGSMTRVRKDGGTEAVPVKLPYGNGAMAVHKALLRRSFSPSLCAKLFSRRLFVSHEFLNLEGMLISEDVCLLLQVIEHISRVECIDDSVYWYVENATSSTHTKYTEKKIDNMLTAFELRRRICGRYPELADDLEHFLTFWTWRLYAFGVSPWVVRRLIHQYGLQEYASVRRAWKVLRIREMLGTIKAIVCIGILSKD